MAKQQFQVEWTLTGDRILVQQLDAEQITPGGIIIPETAKEKPCKGIIIAVGEEYGLNEEGLPKAGRPQVGATILYGKYAGTEVEEKLNGVETKLMLMREADIMGYIK